MPRQLRARIRLVVDVPVDYDVGDPPAIELDGADGGQAGLRDLKAYERAAEKHLVERRNAARHAVREIAPKLEKLVGGQGEIVEVLVEEVSDL